jgi:hypothetical protein
MQLGKLLKPGDVVELEVEGIGVLRNTIAHMVISLHLLVFRPYAVI